MASSTMTLELSSLESREPSSPTFVRQTNFEASSQALNEVTDDPLAVMSKRRAAAIIITVAGVNFLNSVGSGLLTVALPTIAEDLGLSKELLLWPASIYALTCGCTLLLAGSLADIIGRRICFLAGCLFFSVFTLACGLAKSGTQLIVFRGFQGIAISFCLTTAVGIISTSFPSSQGQRRNVAFACVGAGQPVGFTVGLVLGGIFVGSVGWRVAFYMAAGLNVVLFVASAFGLPRDEVSVSRQVIWLRLGREIDWIGAVTATASLSMLSYVMAIITGSSSNIKEVENLVLLSIAVILLPIFVFWMHRQEKLGRPAIIPNSIWRNSAFTFSCIAVFLTWGSFNSFGYFSTLFFQEVQQLSALQTSIRFLPTVVCGILTNIATGFLVRRTSAHYLVAGSSLLSAAAGLLMALCHPSWTFWAAAFPAMFLGPMSSDVLYTISNLIIADAFPPSKQSLAGGVFNTMAQIGNSAGLTAVAVIASSVTAGQKTETELVALEKGYQAAFWACGASIALVVLVSMTGLRKAGKVGLKSE